MKQTETELLITVKAYPNPSTQLGEAACIAGISRGGQFVRLYPIPFRDLEDAQRFKKYQWVRLRASKPKNDPRPETLRPIISSLQLLGAPLPTKNSWASRRDVVLPLAAPSMCDIQDAQASSKTSLGVFKPDTVLDVEAAEEKPRGWTKSERDRLSQKDMFLTKDKRLLEKIPIGFYYRFRCAGCRNKEPHRMKIIDWELAELWRRLRGQHDEKRTIQLVREKFLDTLCGAARDTYFFTGNMQRHPTTFLILGVFWPPVPKQASLF